MKILFIGGTGNISLAASRLAVASGHQLTLLTRGKMGSQVPGARTILADIQQPATVEQALGDECFDAVVNFINYTAEDIERDLRLFSRRCAQYVFISTTATYAAPARLPYREDTPLRNPHWQYARDKISAELRLNRAYQDEGFPFTIVRPSHTYDSWIPAGVGGSRTYTIIDRIERGLPVVVHGDGASLWTITHSSDFACGLVGLLGNPQAIGHAFHITSQEALTWDEIILTLGAAVGREPHMVHIPSDFIAARDAETGASLLGDKKWCKIFDTSKIQQFVPQFRCEIPFHQGIRATLGRYASGELKKVVDPHIHALIDRLVSDYQQISPTQ